MGESFLVLITWASRHLTSQAIDCLFNSSVLSDQKENIKAPHYWPLWGQSTGDRWNPSEIANNAESIPSRVVIIVNTAMASWFADEKHTSTIMRSLDSRFVAFVVLWYGLFLVVLGYPYDCPHYNDVIMSAMASQITGLTIVYSTVYSGTD